jgi:hypothetical protein
VGAASGPETITYATYTTATGALAGITRGLAGTTGVTHANTASVQCSSSALLYTEVSDRLTAVQAGAALALIDGWQDPAETWAYASATSITVPAGNLLKRAVGDKVKCNQSIPLSAYWPMEDKDDDMGVATVANIGTPTYTAGKFSNALTLNGSDQALAITDAAVFKPTGAFTIGAWVKPTASASDKFIFQSFSDNTNANGIEIDCSIFPSKRAHGGFENFGQQEPCWVEMDGARLKEFPINVNAVGNFQLIFSLFQLKFLQVYVLDLFSHYYWVITRHECSEI